MTSAVVAVTSHASHASHASPHPSFWKPEHDTRIPKYASKIKLELRSSAGLNRWVSKALASLVMSWRAAKRIDIHCDLCLKTPVPSGNSIRSESRPFCSCNCLSWSDYRTDKHNVKPNQDGVQKVTRSSPEKVINNSRV